MHFTQIRSRDVGGSDFVFRLKCWFWQAGLSLSVSAVDAASCLTMPWYNNNKTKPIMMSSLIPLDYSFYSGTGSPGNETVCVSQFVQSIGLDKRPFHLAGESMGGNVAGVYAAHYSSYLASVTLICPSGKTHPSCLPPGVEPETVSRS